jgi:hypothetical protein
VLTVSSPASALVLGLRREAGMCGRAGLRIDTDDRYNSLRMALASGPHQADVTVRGQSGAAVFLSPEAARRLTAKVLRASEGAGRVFYVT